MPTRPRSSLFGLPLIIISLTVAVPMGSRRSLVESSAAQSTVAAFDVMEKSIEGLQGALEAKQITSRQLVDLYLARIEAYDRQGPSLNSVMSTNPRAREAADALDAERASGTTRGPLHGIPILVKDNYETIEMPTTAGSIALASFHPARDAVLVQRLKAAGAVILGKTTMHELASGIVTVGSGFGQARNPYDLDRNPGGSSGGTGAAVAANFATAGMGSDTCGSIRNPASHNNLVGLRGTQGLASRTGIVPLSSTQDIGGPIARSIEDLAIILDATVGPDPTDPSTSIAAGQVPRSYRTALNSASLKGARLGILRSQFGSGGDDQEVATIVNRSLEMLRKAGTEVTDVTIPGLEDLLRDSSMISVDFKFDLAAYLAEAGHAPVKSLSDILDRGLYHSALESTLRMRNAVVSRETNTARIARNKRVAIRQALESALANNELTALVYPTLRRKPARIGEAQGGSTCTLSAHSGLPALALPAGFSADGLPIGIDLLGGAFKEAQLLSLGFAIQQSLALRRPPFSTPALMEGKAPAPVATSVSSGSVSITLSYDETTSRVSYAVTGADRDIAQLGTVWIGTGTPAKPGALRHRLMGPGVDRTGTIVLTYRDREELGKNNLMVRFFGPTGRSMGDVPITLSPSSMSKGSR
jgi:Asp-tRNA(Asn)/Glu-tRNA(Gln) amidotransferase A subunit family amidase